MIHTIQLAISFLSFISLSGNGEWAFVIATLTALLASIITYKVSFVSDTVSEVSSENNVLTSGDDVDIAYIRETITELSPDDSESVMSGISDIYTHDDESVLTNLIMSANEDKVSDTIHGYFERVSYDNKELANYLVMNIIRTFLKLANNIKLKDSSDKYKFEDMLKIIKYDNLPAMESEIVNVSRNLCRDINLIKPDDGESIGKRVIKYIEDNYSDRDLDVSKISDYLNFSPSYAIKLFKQETGEGISQYINRYRVEKAKELLSLDIYRVEQIARMVGFSDSRGLSRSFKSVYGVTPTQYKEISSLEKK